MRVMALETVLIDEFPNVTTSSLGYLAGYCAV
jgi:hypothetical protein